MEMNRRTFLKGAAVTAAAAAMSGLLAGCDGSDPGTDLGGFTVALDKWSVVPHDQGIGTGLSWYADFQVAARVHNLDNANGFSYPAKLIFILKINGEKIALQAGGLLSNTSLVMAKNEYKTGTLTFRLDESQQYLYEAMKNRTASIQLTVGVDPVETYTGSYDSYTFVKA